MRLIPFKTLETNSDRTATRRPLRCGMLAQLEWSASALSLPEFLSSGLWDKARERFRAAGQCAFRVRAERWSECAGSHRPQSCHVSGRHGWKAIPVRPPEV